MAQPTLSRRLTSLDAAFLYFEKKEAPLHIGSVSIFDGDIPFDDFVETLESKLYLLPRYRQKIVADPFRLGHPSWEDDEYFDISHHVFKLKIDPPGTDSELIELTSRILTPLMERGKPLWDVHLIYGLEGGRTAMISRVHHCMVDGVSGVDLIKIVLDLSPTASRHPDIPRPPKPAAPARVDPTRRLFDSLLGSMQEGMDRWMDFQDGLLKLTQTLLKEPEPRAAMCEASLLLPKLAAPVALLPFNRQCSGERKLVWSTFSFAEARAIRAVAGGTVNDVVLTVLAGAVSRYVQMHGQPVAGRVVRIMVPVSLRQDEQRGTLGNLLSLLPVEIPLDLSNPIERLGYTAAITKALKKAQAAEGLNLLLALLGLLPPPLQAIAGAIIPTPLPPFNMVATNVPGPQVPLYAMGKRMVAYYPYVPIGFAIGCGCAIMSYDQKLYFGLSSDRQAMPDVEELKRFLDDSFGELRAAAGVEEIKPHRKQAASGT